MGCRLYLILIFPFLISSCGIKKAADEAAETSKEIKRESEHLRKRTDDMERELVKKESFAVVKENLDLIFGEGQFGFQEISEPTLLLSAGVAIEAMHFQMWKGDYYENMKMLDEFFACPLEMMFVHATRHIPRHGRVDKRRPDRAFKAVGSLAAKLDRLSYEYVRNVKRVGMQPLSLYDVMVQALRNRGRSVREENLPEATAMVLRWKQEAIYMLQMRHNYLPLTVLGRMSNFQEKADFLDWEFWDTRLTDAMFGQTVDLGAADPEQLKEWTGWLRQAAVTRQDLADMCIKPQYNGMISRILKNVTFMGVSHAASVPELREFLDAYKMVSDQRVNLTAVENCLR